MLATDDPFHEAEQHQLQRGNWVVAGLETHVFWPNRPQLITFEGLDFLLQPTKVDEQHRSPPAIALRIPTAEMNVNQARAAIMRLATAIAWREGTKVEIVMWGGGSHPHRVGMLRNNAFTEYFSGENLHSPQSDDARKAMAYYREGLSLSNPFYSFLGFYKAFARSLPVGKERGSWITSVLPAMSDPDAISRRDELVAQGVDISDYLATQGRHAIAHAEREDIVDPDDPEDHQRIHQDKPLMRHLAEIAMDQRLHVPPRWAYERDHLYEIEGFRSMFDAEQLDRLKRGKLIPGRDYQLPDDVYVLSRKGKSTVHLGDMHVANSCLDDGKIGVRLESPDGRIAFIFWLDFTNERLIINPVEACGLLNGRRESRSDLESELRLEEFKFALFCNGSVEIWTPDRTKRLGKSEAYILPANYMPDVQDHRARVEALTAQLQALPASGP